MSGLWLGHIRIAGHGRPRARTCPSLEFLAYIRGLSAPLRTLGFDKECLKMYSLEIHTTRKIMNYSKEDPLNMVHLRNKVCYNLVKERGTDERF
jgi:hypothetical protein